MKQERLLQQDGTLKVKGVGEIAWDRNKWPEIVAKPFTKTVSLHYCGMVSVVMRQFATKVASGVDR